MNNTNTNSSVQATMTLKNKKLLNFIIKIIILFLFTLASAVFFLKNPIFNTKLKVTRIPEAQVQNLKNTVSALTGVQPPRSIHNIQSLNMTAQFLFNQLKSYGYHPQYQEYQVNGLTYKNVIAHFNKNKRPPLVFGAHYDVAHDTPGADDNASGVAALLELSRLLKDLEMGELKLKNAIEIVFYSLEEPPSFRTPQMGSYIHAESLAKSNRDIKLMVSLESLGYYSSEPNSQRYPLSLLSWIFPTTGHFVAVVGDLGSWLTTRKFKSLFTLTSHIAIESLNAPPRLAGIDFSDHLNYWKFNYPALMLTDTALYRNPHYHKLTDTEKTLDYQKLKEVVQGLIGVALNY